MCYAYGNIRTANIQPNPLKDGMPQFMNDVIMEISKAKTFYTCNIHKHSQTTPFWVCVIHHIYVTIFSTVQECSLTTMEEKQ